MLSAEEIKSIDHEVAKLPQKRAAVIEALKIIQQHRGWVEHEPCGGGQCCNFLQSHIP